MSPKVTFGSILVLTFANSSVMVVLPLSLPFDTVVEVVFNPLVSAEVEGVECLFDLAPVAERKLWPMDDRKRLNVLGCVSGLSGGPEPELSLGSRSRAMLKGLEVASCVRRCRRANGMYDVHPERCDGGERRKLRGPT